MPDMYCYIYYRIDGITPFYVGKGSLKRARALTQHNRHCKTLIKSDGRENIRIELLPCETEDEALYWERMLVTQLRMFYHLANYTDGGDRGHERGTPTHNKGKSMSEPQRQKLSNMAKLRIGKLNSFFGKTHNDRTKELIRNARLGTTISEETRKKKSMAMMGKRCPTQKLSLDQINEIRKATLSIKELAAKYNIHWVTVYAIKNGTGYYGKGQYALTKI